jgi:hypothetical protein
VPQQVEDKWFVYADAGWVYFHRSRTGVLIYALRLDGSPAGVRVVESWVNRDPAQYTESDLVYDRAFLDFLIRTALLGESAELPVRT